MVKRLGLRLRQVAVGETHDGDGLLTAERPAQPELIADAQQAMGFGAVAIHFDFSSLAGALCFRSRLIETRDIQPDIEPDACIGLSHLNSL